MEKEGVREEEAVCVKVLPPPNSEGVGALEIVGKQDVQTLALPVEVPLPEREP